VEFKQAMNERRAETRERIFVPGRELLNGNDRNRRRRPELFSKPDIRLTSGPTSGIVPVGTIKTRGQRTAGSMTITVPLTPEEEASLKALAAGRGMSPDALIKNAVKQLLEYGAPTIAVQDVPPNERERQVEELFKAFDAESVPATIGEGAFHRENWYR
jgi:hypothetical protein